jgi:hypothetical protein
VEAVEGWQIDKEIGLQFPYQALLAEKIVFNAPKD